MRLPLLLLAFALGCGAATRPPQASGEVASIEPAEATPAPAPEAPRPPVFGGVDLSGPVAVIMIEEPSTEEHVHHCYFRLSEGRPVEWACYGRGEVTQMPFGATSVDDLSRLLGAVDGWGVPLAEGELAPVTITLSRGSLVLGRFAVTPEAESASLRAFRQGAMAAAQVELAAVRRAPQPCDRCPPGQYCLEGWSCSSLMKNCSPELECRVVLPATSPCVHDYECRSGRCEGASELRGACAASPGVSVRRERARRRGSPAAARSPAGAAGRSRTACSRRAACGRS